jgi:hypothetical protein
VLLGRLADRARANGVGRLRALVLADNRRALALVAHVGPERIVDRDGNTVAVEVRLAPSGRGPGSAARSRRPPG